MGFTINLDLVARLTILTLKILPLDINIEIVVTVLALLKSVESGKGRLSLFVN